MNPDAQAEIIAELQDYASTTIRVIEGGEVDDVSALELWAANQGSDLMCMALACLVYGAERIEIGGGAEPKCTMVVVSRGKV